MGPLGQSRRVRPSSCFSHNITDPSALTPQRWFLSPQNPRNWPKAKKWRISMVGILFCALVSLSVSGYAIAQESVIVELKAKKELVILGSELVISLASFDYDNLEY